jgi:hypothetical protein
MIDLDRPISPEEIAEIAEGRKLPPVAELKRLLDLYFEGPITDDIAEKLHSSMVAMRADEPRHRGEVGAYLGNMVRGHGRAWFEDFTRGRTLVREVDLALFHAATTRGYPKAKPHCPQPFVGTWTQRGATARDSSPVTWTFGDDGSFATNLPRVATARRWCIHTYQTPRGDPGASEVWVRDDAYGSWDRFDIEAVAERSITLTFYDRGPIEHILER